MYKKYILELSRFDKIKFSATLRDPDGKNTAPARRLRRCGEEEAFQEIDFTDRFRAKIRHVWSILLTAFVSKSPTAFEFSKIKKIAHEGAAPRRLRVPLAAGQGGVHLPAHGRSEPQPERCLWHEGESVWMQGQSYKGQISVVSSLIVAKND